MPPNSEEEGALRPRPSLRDLARQLGVSHTTINLALQGEGRISAARREQIREAAARAGYLPNDLGPRLRTGRTGLIGLVIPTLRSGFVSALLEGVLPTLAGAGFSPLLQLSGFEVAREAHLLEQLARQRVEGVILIPSREDSGRQHFAALLAEHVPLVALNNPVPKLRLPLIASDDTLGGQLATRHLLANGHQRILHIGLPLDNRQIDRRREEGYRQTMLEAGLKPKIIRFTHRPGPDAHDPAFREQLARTLPRYSAVFCFNDAVALEVYRFCREEGIAIPGDLSVVGYSNEGYPFDFLSPPLTSVDQNAERMGERAATMLLERIRDQSSRAAEVLIDPFLVQRDSVRPKVVTTLPTTQCRKGADRSADG